ncbi:glycosyltransferase N-terminal domain-containing protein [Hydrogenophaga sp.]|uniref:3-deoxy-D-manno-octulosonic acid transferase n=1 Tax=Hydrogenophaga sp. TaxID=1904254 RepID=UPI00261AB190|nr:glycosyltransferase N-terminal domain-containing protein [Hydrogenophaga sp.]MDM7950124.1 glycosyltransferase N-terminal domain-containing protein [Hydrogenophaga sp.]
MSQRPLALRAYLSLASALAPVWRWGLQHRLTRGKETVASIQQKLSLQMPPRPVGPLVWGHAVGVGESMALAGLFHRLGESRPDLHFLITTTARTSGDALQRQGLPLRCQHQFAPVDTPEATARFMGHWQPTLALWCEMDLWPALITAADNQGVPRVLVNARLSEQSLRKRRWGRWIYQALLPGFADVFAQNAESARGLTSLGARAERITVSGTIKTLSPPLSHDAGEFARWRGSLGTRPIWLLASSHPGEETLALQAHEALRQHKPDALLIIAPRVPTRGAEVAALCPPGTPQRSQGQSLPTTAPVYLADTIGELGLWYRLAPVALVGGSLAQVGGHNPLEPLALGCTVLHGPKVWNFSESYARLDAQGLSRPINDPSELASAVQAVWSSPGPREDRRPPEPQADRLLQRLQAHL